MNYVSPDTDDASDIERRRRAVAGLRRGRVGVLLDNAALCAVDRGFLLRLRDRDLIEMTAADRDRFDQLIWQHRRDLPAGLRPKLPPYDPIVRALEDADG